MQIRKNIASFSSSPYDDTPHTTLFASIEERKEATTTTISTTEKETNTVTKPFIELQHPETNATIVLVGCLHGASSSANDVNTILNEKHTDVVVLELCPTRYKDLMKYYLNQNKQKESEGNASFNSNSNPFMERNPKGDYLKMVSKTIETKGFSTGIAAAVLGGATGLSSALSGFEAGLEFMTAINYVQQQNKEEETRVQDGAGNKGAKTTKASRDCDIILGDQIVDETLKRVGSLPTVSLNMWKDFQRQGFNWKSTYHKDAMVLNNAILGDDQLKQKGYQIEMGSFLFRNRDVVSDLFRLTLPTLLLVQLSVLLLNNGLILSVLGDTWVDLAPSLSQSDWQSLATDLSVEILTSAIVLFVGYIALALPAVRVILSERDSQLVDAIHSACKVAAEKCEKIDGDDTNNDDSSNSQHPRVVAVLGLLHVNGIAKSILNM